MLHSLKAIGQYGLNLNGLITVPSNYCIVNIKSIEHYDCRKIYICPTGKHRNMVSTSRVEKHEWLDDNQYCVSRKDYCTSILSSWQCLHFTSREAWMIGWQPMLYLERLLHIHFVFVILPLETKSNKTRFKQPFSILYVVGQKDSDFCRLNLS